MTVHVCSDIHFSHRNIFKYCPHRQHPGIDLENITDEDCAKMNEKIIARWNSMVMPEDETYIIGDVAMGQIFKAPALIRRLNGTKYLIRGNHDKTLVRDILKDPSLSNLFAWVESYHEMTYKYGGEKIMINMSHYPMHSWNGMTGDNKSSIHFHGHLHSPAHARHILPGRIFDVGIDGNDLYPYRIEEAIKLAIRHAEKNPAKLRHT